MAWDGEDITLFEASISLSLTDSEFCEVTSPGVFVGTWIASGSDDTKVIVWDMATRRPYINFFSGHTSNVFQVENLCFD